jgi:hypothetical protein
MNLGDYIKNTMIVVPKGTEQIRRFRDEQKWLSSNYQTFDICFTVIKILRCLQNTSF